MNQEIRNRLRNVVTQSRKLLEDSITQDLEGRFGIFARNGQVTADPNAAMTHLTEEERAARKDILDHFEHIKARGFKPKEALDQLIREIAFTHLNRLCAYKMMEAREVYVDGQKFREAVSRGVNSNGVKFYLADHPEDERLFNTGHQDIAYRHFLNWLGGLLSDEIGVLFNPNDPANRLYPRQNTLDEVLNLLNSGGIKPEDTELRDAWPCIWTSDETIGWVYQYFTPKELRDQARKESSAPRNSYELAFRNQFFTPRYVVEFLTDNTLGRIWFEMRKGETKLRDRCRYMVRRPTECFLSEGEQAPADAAGEETNVSKEESLRLPLYIPHRPKKDPRDLKILDPASGSGHFLLYCFDLLQTIYEEAYLDPDLGPSLQNDYATIDELRKQTPRLILGHNLYGIDIDLRATQIAALALWLRCQSAYQEMGLKKDRPEITRSNLVCAEPMPGEEQVLRDFVGQLEPKVLGKVVEVVFDRMKLAGEAGSLLRIEEEIRDAIAAAKKQWIRETAQARDKKGEALLFTQREMDRLAGQIEQDALFDLSDITDTQFFEEAERKVIGALRHYAERAQNGQGLKRRLFTEDAVRGFAFIDVCQKHFDVALMNPPFGSAVPSTRNYFSSAYPNTSHDLCAATIDRCTGLLSACGILGALTTRTALFLQSFAAWRDTVLSDWRFSSVADLGYGVLDAMVETAMYVIEKRKSLPADLVSFVNVLTTVSKDDAVLKACSPAASAVEWRQQRVFETIPGKPLAYWVPQQLLGRFAQFPIFNDAGGDIRQGLATADDFRFLRLSWEVLPSSINTSAPEIDPQFQTHYWTPMAKGGEYSPWWDDVHLLLNWHLGGREVREFRDDETGKLRSRPQNLEWFFRGGLTYPYRTTSAFGLRCLPRGCAFNNGARGVFPKGVYTYQDLLATYNSRVARYFMEILLGQGDSSVAGSAARNNVSESVGGIPFPPHSLGLSAAQKVDELIGIWRQITADETTAYYAGPRYLRCYTDSIRSGAAAAWTERCRSFARIAELSSDLDSAVCRGYALSKEEESWIAKEEGPHPSDYPETDVSVDRVRSLFLSGSEEIIRQTQSAIGSKRFVVKKAFFISREIDLLCHLFGVPPTVILRAITCDEAVSSAWLREQAEEIVSMSVGMVFGRWDIRKVLQGELQDEPTDPLSYVPRFSPFRLDIEDQAKDNVGNYPLRINHDGILVDDPDHSDDIVRQISNVLEVIWQDEGHRIEAEACQSFGAPNMREFLSTPSNNGFWQSHISRYSKSRRKAPIYWLLQSSKRSYGLWLYYNRLHKDTLFKALVNYVEPKIRLETSRLDTLRTQKSKEGGSGKDSKRLAKSIEKQEDLLSEVRDFEDKLRRVANLYLVPDLNDGVVLNIAPLRELVPWKEAANHWEDLLEGKYEWSSIGKQLRQKGLVR